MSRALIDVFYVNTFKWTTDIISGLLPRTSFRKHSDFKMKEQEVQPCTFICGFVTFSCRLFRKGWNANVFLEKSYIQEFISLRSILYILQTVRRHVFWISFYLWVNGIPSEPKKVWWFQIRHFETCAALPGFKLTRRHHKKLM